MQLMTVEALKSVLQSEFPGDEVKVFDLTGTSDHFEVQITSARFAGLTLIQQHKLVHAAVGDRLTGPIHALKIKTRVPRGA